MSSLPGNTLFGTATRALLLSLLFGTSACTYDFDQFRDAPRADMSVSPDQGDMPGQDMEADGDMTLNPDADMAEDLVEMGPNGAMTGATCARDGDCADGLCQQGVCTKACEADDMCAAPALCRQIEPGMARCVVACEVDADCGAGRVCGAGACLPDADEDGIADWLDNCVTVANPTQQDLDLDGEGDACDADVLCPTGHVEGVRALDVSGLRASVDGLASSASGRFVLLTAGDAVWRLDLTAGNVARHATLPYAATGHGVIDLGDGTGWLTPGVGLGQASGQTGRWLGVAANGTIKEAGPFVQDVARPTGAVTRFGALLLGSTQASRQAPNNLQVERVTPDDGAAQLAAQYPLEQAGQMFLMEDWAGSVLAYSAPFQAAADQPWRLVMWTADANGRIVDGRLVALPNAEGSAEPIAPSFVRTRQGLLIGLDRVTGQAWRFVAGRPEGEWIRMAGLDVAWGVEGAPRVLALRGGAGVVVIGQAAGVPVARQIALACLPGAAAMDGDADGVSDVRDTCPELMEADQTDTDGDGLGDVCDGDDDADGVPDAADVRVIDPNTGETESLALDTDNDGTPNAQDPDDDGDGRPDTRDKWPLDFDDDGLMPWEDGDSDNDGYADVEEAQAGSDPRAPLSIPNGGRLVWVSAGAVRVAALASLESGQVVEFGAGTTPTTARWAPASEHVLALDGEPGVATAVMMQQPGLTVAPERFELGQKVRSAALVAPDPRDPLGRPGVVAVHEAEGMAGRWVVSRLAFEDASIKRLIVGTLTAISEVSGWSDRVYVAGSTAECAGCARAWTQPAWEDQRLTAVSPSVSAVREVRRSGNTVCVVGASEKEPEAAAWVDNQRRMPPGAVSVARCVPLAQDGHLIVRAQDAQGSYALWLFNGRIQQWVRLPAALDSASDLDWKQ